MDNKKMKKFKCFTNCFINKYIVNKLYIITNAFIKDNKENRKY